MSVVCAMSVFLVSIEILSLSLRRVACICTYTRFVHTARNSLYASFAFEKVSVFVVVAAVFSHLSSRLFGFESNRIAQQTTVALVYREHSYDIDVR